jgi:chemotaxis protein MotB
MSNRRKRGGGGGEGGGEERWLLPYADMITLLLGLFIVLFAMSTVDAKKFENVSSALSNTFKGQVLSAPGAVVTGNTSPLSANAAANSEYSRARESASSTTAETFDKEQAELKKDAEQALSGEVKVSTDSRGIVVTIAGDTLFDSGSAQLRPGTEAYLTKLSRELTRFGRPIEIQGHTDGAPISSSQYPDNMTLSFGRAYSVWKVLMAAGFSPKVDATPVPRANYDPVVKPKHPHDSVPANRRVEIHILAPGVDDRGLPTPQEIAAAKSSGHQTTPKMSSAGDLDKPKGAPTLRMAPPDLKPKSPANTPLLTDAQVGVAP